LSTEIYYFSGTGNSLALAVDVAGKTGGKLIPISSVMDNDEIKLEADAVGIVFPTYYETYGGVPLIVRRFVNKLENLESKYVFGICTYGGASVTALKCLDRLVKARGGKLSAWFTVNMPSNMAGSNMNNPQKQEKMFHIWNENLEHIAEFINTQKEGKYDTENSLFGRAYFLLKLIYSPLMFLFKPTTLKQLKRYSSSSLSYAEQLQFMDRSFSTNDNCTGCGTCDKICPVNNIELVDDKPSWQHHCEFCLACFHWCPKEAIISPELKNTVRYHHPNVQLTDMYRVK
jgi:formate hydrogenlyase subunit 6/NADH:ubiquinone oxidoreductase subunit I/flavodoxin